MLSKVFFINYKCCYTKCRGLSVVGPLKGHVWCLSVSTWLISQGGETKKKVENFKVEFIFFPDDVVTRIRIYLLLISAASWQTYILLSIPLNLFFSIIFFFFSFYLSLLSLLSLSLLFLISSLSLSRSFPLSLFLSFLPSLSFLPYLSLSSLSLSFFFSLSIYLLFISLLFHFSFFFSNFLSYFAFSLFPFLLNFISMFPSIKISLSQIHIVPLSIFI